MIDALIEEAKARNLKAIELLLDRVWPARRGRPLQIAASEIRGASDLLAAAGVVTSGVLNGDLSVEEGAATARVLGQHGRLIDLVEYEQLLRRLVEESAERRGK